MKISPCSQLSFADQIVSDRKVKDVFFSQINQLIDWKPLARLIEQVYTKGNSSTGRPSYEGILLFKIELLRTWYGLSDPEVEEQIKDRLSFMRFLGLSLEDSVPDSTTICHFRNALVSGGLNDQLLFEVNRQLEAAGVIIKSRPLQNPLIKLSNPFFFSDWTIFFGKSRDFDVSTPKRAF